MWCLGDEKVCQNYDRYYDTPEGCQIEKKVLVTTRYGALAGFLLGTFDVLMYSHAVGFGPVIKRYMVHILPLAMIGATFSVVANGLVRVRERDDHLNYFLGGLACGPIVGYYFGSKHAIFIGGLALGISGLVKKEAVNTRTCLMPDFPSHMNSIWSWRYDWTFVKDPRDEMIHSCGKK